jgi:hypothetical protein
MYSQQQSSCKMDGVVNGGESSRVDETEKTECLSLSLGASFQWCEERKKRARRREWQL